MILVTLGVFFIKIYVTGKILVLVISITLTNGEAQTRYFVEWL